MQMLNRKAMSNKEVDTLSAPKPCAYAWGEPKKRNTGINPIPLLKFRWDKGIYGILLFAAVFPRVVKFIIQPVKHTVKQR